MNKKVVLYICLFCILVVLLVAAFLFVNKRISNKEEYHKANTTNETIRSREEENFVKNQIIVGFDEKESNDDITRTLDNLEGLKSHETLGLNAYLVTFKENFKSLNDIKNYCNQLVKDTIISVCEPNHIIQLDDCSKGPC